MTPSRHFTCFVPGCSRPSVRGFGGCDICDRQLCDAHIQPSFHTCVEDLSDAAYEAGIYSELVALTSRIDDNAVCHLASQLNGGNGCTVEYSYKVGPGALCGCANYHARIRFSDGSTPWLLRVPRVTSRSVGFPVPLADFLIRSEYATLKFLESTDVPAPRVFAYGTICDGNDSGVGVSFLLMEELPGEPWTRHVPSGNEATAEEKGKVWRGVADILAELAKHPFRRAGSLSVAQSGESVGPVATDRFFVLDAAGPYETSEAYYTAHVEQYLALIADGQIYTEFPVNAYLVYRFLKDNVYQLVDSNLEQGGVEQEEAFFLKHVDDTGSHLLVDKDLNITGIIDWQMARTVPAREAFGPSLVTADMGAIYSGKVSLSEDDEVLPFTLARNGRPDLAQYMRDEKTRRFFWGLGMERDWTAALPIANAVLEAFGAELRWEEWREGALVAYRDDERLAGLLCGTPGQ